MLWLWVSEQLKFKQQQRVLQQIHTYPCFALTTLRKHLAYLSSSLLAAAVNLVCNALLKGLFVKRQRLVSFRLHRTGSHIARSAENTCLAFMIYCTPDGKLWIGHQHTFWQNTIEYQVGVERSKVWVRISISRALGKKRRTLIFHLLSRMTLAIQKKRNVAKHLS